MSKKTKNIILFITTLLVLIIFLQGQYKIFDFNKNNEFSITSKPLTAFNEARENGEPIFLEFYASW